ncbi:MAG TPA: phage tail assembly protein [Xanthobacteraceae bacterium]|jgi:hypothetical protein
MNQPAVKPVREGFVREAEPAPPLEPPRDAPPQPVLPTQMKLEQPPLEPALSETDKLRKDIAAASDSWPITVQLLYKPIMNDKGETINALSFREPRASEINRIGNPTRMLWDGEIILEERKMTYIMAALCGVLPPLLEAMDPRDWNSCAYRLRKFFLPDLRGW